jgi:hypothetical protein
MNHVGWMHCDVSASNCLLSYDPADGPSLILDMELAKKIDIQASASNTAICVSGSGSTNEIFAYHKTQGTAQFMARELLGSLIDQEDSDFVHPPQDDFESLVYVLAYAVMKKESSTMSVKDEDHTKLATMTDLYHEAFGHNAIYAIQHARTDISETWEKYQAVVTGGEPSVLHEIVRALLIEVDNQYTSQRTSMFTQDTIPARPAVPMDGKRMWKILKRGIAVEKASLKDDSAGSDVDANYD